MFEVCSLADVLGSTVSTAGDCSVWFWSLFLGEEYSTKVSVNLPIYWPGLVLVLLQPALSPQVDDLVGLSRDLCVLEWVGPAGPVWLESDSPGHDVVIWQWAVSPAERGRQTGTEYSRSLDKAAACFLAPELSRLTGTYQS